MMSLHFLPMLHLLLVSQPIMAIPTKLSSCACTINLGQLLRPSFPSSFQRENIYTLLSSFLLSILYAFVHVFQVSKQGVRHIIFCSFIPVSSYAHVCTNKSFSILLQMADWIFKKALVAIKSPPSIPFDTLLSPVGLCLGDIRFAKIQTNLRMRTVAIAVLEEWILNGSFNPHHKPDEDCSCTTAILIILTPNTQGTGLTYASVGLIIRRHKGPVGWIEDIPRLITSIQSQLKGDRLTSPNARKTYCMIVGDYGGPLAFATEPPFCTAYPLSFSNRDDPSQMTFHHAHNHP